jgi:hypothetical protein
MFQNILDKVRIKILESISLFRKHLKNNLSLASFKISIPGKNNALFRLPYQLWAFLEIIWNSDHIVRFLLSLLLTLQLENDFRHRQVLIRFDQIKFNLIYNLLVYLR